MILDSGSFGPIGSCCVPTVSVKANTIAVTRRICMLTKCSGHLREVCMFAILQPKVPILQICNRVLQNWVMACSRTVCI